MCSFQVFTFHLPLSKENLKKEFVPSLRLTNVPAYEVPNSPWRISLHCVTKMHFAKLGCLLKTHKVQRLVWKESAGQVLHACLHPLVSKLKIHSNPLRFYFRVKLSNRLLAVLHLLTPFLPLRSQFPTVHTHEKDWFSFSQTKLFSYWPRGRLIWPVEITDTGTGDLVCSARRQMPHLLALGGFSLIILPRSELSILLKLSALEVRNEWGWLTLGKKES